MLLFVTKEGLQSIDTVCLGGLCVTAVSYLIMATSSSASLLFLAACLQLNSVTTVGCPDTHIYRISRYIYHIYTGQHPVPAEQAGGRGPQRQGDQ